MNKPTQHAGSIAQRARVTRLMTSLVLGLGVLPALVISTGRLLPQQISSAAPPSSVHALHEEAAGFQALQQGPQMDCLITPTRRVAPLTTRIGTLVGVTLHFHAICIMPPQPTHIVFAIDASESVGQESLSQTLESLSRLNQLVDIPREHVPIGAIVFDSEVRRSCPMDVNKDAFETCTRSVRSQGQSRIESGLDAASDLLESARSPDIRDPNEIVLLLTTGNSQNGCDAAKESAGRIHSRGQLLITAGIGPEENRHQVCLGQLASSNRYHDEEFKPDGIHQVFERIIDTERYPHGLFKKLVITDTLASEFILDPESTHRSWRQEGSNLVFDQNFMPSDGITISYAFRPQKLGTFDTPRRSNYRILDGWNRLHTGEFPVESIRVLDQLFLPFFTQPAQ